jgi:sulfate-transporting ATPase
MRILAGADTQLAEGRVSLSPGIRIGYLEQEPELKDGARRVCTRV